MRAVVLAAGFGTRLGAAAGGLPKALLPLGARRAVDFVVEAAEALPAVEGIDVVTNDLHHADLVAWAAARRGTRPLRLWNDGARSAETRRGAIGDLAFFLERARPAVPVLVLAADNVFDFALDALAAHAAREPVVALYDVGSPEQVRRYASVELRADGTLAQFVEKDPEPTGTLACVALYGLPVDALPDVPRYLAEGGAPDNLGYFVEWLHRRRPVRGLVMRGRWLDVGSPDDYDRARRVFGAASAER